MQETHLQSTVNLFSSTSPQSSATAISQTSPSTSSSASASPPLATPTSELKEQHQPTPDDLFKLVVELTKLQHLQQSLVPANAAQSKTVYASGVQSSASPRQSDMISTQMHQSSEVYQTIVQTGAHLPQSNQPHGHGSWFAQALASNIPVIPLAWPQPFASQLNLGQSHQVQVPNLAGLSPSTVTPLVQAESEDESSDRNRQRMFGALGSPPVDQHPSGYQPDQASSGERVSASSIVQCFPPTPVSGRFTSLSPPQRACDAAEPTLPPKDPNGAASAAAAFYATTASSAAKAGAVGTPTPTASPKPLSMASFKPQKPPPEIPPEDLDMLNDPSLSAREKRALRNKLSARNFRERRKEYIETLEAELQRRDAEISRLKRQLEGVREEREELRATVKELRGRGRTENAALGPTSAPTPPPHDIPNRLPLNAATAPATGAAAQVEPQVFDPQAFFADLFRAANPDFQLATVSRRAKDPTLPVTIQALHTIHLNHSHALAAQEPQTPAETLMKHLKKHSGRSFVATEADSVDRASVGTGVRRPSRALHHERMRLPSRPRAPDSLRRSGSGRPLGRVRGPANHRTPNKHSQ